MINLKQELEYYPFIDLKGLEESNPNIPDNIKNSIILYNKALESLRTNSEDMAIIELKKAVAMNPTFYEAMNLLGLCYSLINEKTKAAQMFQKVINAETNGIRANKYMKDIDEGENPASMPAKAKKRNTYGKAGAKPAPVEASPFYVMLGEKLKKELRKEWVKYLAGFAAGAILVFLICLPFLLGAGRPVSSPESEILAEELKSELEQMEREYAQLESSFKGLQEELEEANSSLEYYKYAAKLSEVGSFIAQKDYIQAADLLLLMKAVEFTSPEKEHFDSLYEQAVPQAAKLTYDNGFALYNQRKYEDAIKELDKVGVYMEDYEKMDAVLYYTGRSYQALNDSRSALANYQRILDEFAGSTYVRYARNRINELTRNP